MIRVRHDQLALYLRNGLKLLRTNGFKFLQNPEASINEHLQVLEYERAVNYLTSTSYRSADLTQNKDIMLSFSKMKDIQIKTVNWFVPYLSHAFGGFHTILRFANYFSTKKGIENRFIVYGNPIASEDEIRDRIAGIFPDLLSEEILVLTDNNLDNVPPADICIATLWTSAYLVMRFKKTKGKFYFIQDYEPYFCPPGIIYALAEATYRFGFHGIVNSQGLYDFYVRNYGGNAEYFTPVVDREVFYPSKREPARPSVQNPFTIFFYARVGTPRNAFELGAAALREIKKNYGELVRVYAAGSEWNTRAYDLDKTIINLGILQYEKTAMLYRKCDLGIVFCFTKHPSYIPFELIACGCSVISNYNSATTWLLKDGFNCLLVEPSISSICEKVDLLMNRPDLRKRMVTNALASLPATSWDTEIEKIYHYMTNPTPTQSQ